jgi:hypothetical protein
MMRFFLFALLTLATAAVGLAQSNPGQVLHKGDWILLGADAVSVSLDGWTTTKYLSYPNTRELDPILGRHPGAARVGLTFAAEAAARYALTYELARHGHRKFARAILGATVGIETGCIIDNFSIMKRRGY